MPHARFERLEPDRRERLLVAAAREFSLVGFEPASLGRIAEQAGFSKPGLYYYFEDKADLYATVVRAAWERLSPQRRLEPESLSRDDFWPALAAFHLASYEGSLREPWLLAAWKLAYHPPREPAASGAVTEVFATARAFLKAFLRRGQELGVVRTDLPEELLIALLTGVDNAADHWLVDHWEAIGPEEIARLSRCVFDAMRTLVSPQASERGA